MPKYVWSIDVSDKENFINHKVTNKIIIDATCTTSDREPWILMHDRHKVYLYDDSNLGFDILEVDIEPYTMYKGSLKEV